MGEILLSRRSVILTLWLISFSALSLFQSCKGQERSKNTTRSISSTPSEQISSSESSDSEYNRSQSIALYKRITGVTPHLDHPLIKEMTTYLDQGDPYSAAYLATSEPGFYNITVRDFAVKLSNVELSVRAPLNDLAATVIGSVRDDVSAINLLTENYYYNAAGTPGIPSDIENDIVKTNNHYEELESQGHDLSVVLKKEVGQKVLASNGQIATLSDSAGILTSRAFMAAHADAGTNRRVIEYTFKTFLCTPIDEWANSNNPDNRVGPDVGRFPQSDYLNKCKACHTGMDALRPATAYFDFSDGFIKHNYTYTMDPNPENPSQMNIPVPSSEQNVPYKFRRSSSNFSDGFRVSNNNWINYADNSKFGFRTSGNGQGMQELGQLVAYSEQFSKCMVQRVFESICRRSISEEDEALIEDLASQFENDSYNLRQLFVNIAIQRQCIGLEI